MNLTVNPILTSSYSHSICAGASYLFNGTNITVGGSYKDTLASASGCDSIITLNLTVNPIATFAYNYTICDNNSYIFGGNNLTITGTYKDILTSVIGCDSIVTLNLSVDPILTSLYNHNICVGSSYLFNDNNLTIGGTYKDTLVSVTGCDSIITLNLGINPIVSSSYNHSICVGSSYLFNGNHLTAAGTYKDTLVSSTGCDSIITLNLSIHSILTSSYNQSICASSSYLFNGNNLTVAGAYKDTLTSISGCDSIITLNLTVNPILTSSYSYSICASSSYLFNGNNLIVAGAYKDTLTSIFGCDSIVTLNLFVNPIPIAAVSSDITIAQGSSIKLLASGGSIYNWTPAAGLNTTTSSTIIASPFNTTIYCVTASDLNSCSDTACVTITVITPESPCIALPNLAVPNAFSPNGDGVNEEFCLQGWDGNCIEDFIISVFNRWGEKIYESKNPSFCWDGKYNGIPMDAQVFVYIIKAKYNNQKEKIEKSGNISLIR